MTNASNFFSKSQQQQIVKAIQQAEQNTSGEIRVHLDTVCRGEVLDRAAFIFKKLKMYKTEKRNGVLFYLSVKDHKFAVIGDQGINEIVEDNFWENIKNEMIDSFKKNMFAEGLINGIEQCGQQLKQHFPYKSDDINELSDDISFEQ